MDAAGRRAATLAARSGAGGLHRLLGVGRHRGLAVAHADAGQGRLRRRPAERRGAHSWGRRGIRQRTRPTATSAAPTAPRRSCACRAGSTSPGRTTRTLKIETDVGHADAAAALRRARRLIRHSPNGRAIRWRSGNGPMRGPGPPDNLPIALNPREGNARPLARGRHHEPAPRLPAQERRSLQRPDDAEGVLRSLHRAQRRHLVRRHHHRRGSRST